MYNEYDNTYYFISKLENEIDISYNLRKWIISKMKPKNKEEFLNSQKIAKLYVNMKILNVKYDNNIENIVLNKIQQIFN